MNKKAFTLFEIVLALIIFSMLIGIIFTTYINIKKSEGDIGNQQLVTKEANDFLERLDDLSLDYTIDYEEYFNRTMLGCNTGDDLFQRNISGSCEIFTDYGNTSDLGGLYYCQNTGYDSKSGYYYREFIYGVLPILAGFYSGPMGLDFKNHLGCTQTGRQHFGEYKRQFRNIEDGYLNNGNDEFIGEGPVAISNNTGVQELYLINNDGDHRVYFRRKYVTGVDLNGDGLLTGKNESLYTIQTLKLKGFDAGTGHNFDTGYWGVYDGFIDTRACDAEAGFVCSGASVLNDGGLEYNLPADIDDGRVDITDSRVTVSDWNFELYPAKDPYLAQNDYEYLFDPYAIISLTTNIYGELSSEDITLQTSISFKNSYHNFEIKELTGFLP